MHVSRHVAPRHGWLRVLVSLAVLLVQAVIAVSPLAEARGGVGAVAHAESKNEGRHYAHAEANCAFCAASSIHAPAVRAPSGFRLTTERSACCIAVRTEVATPDLQPPYLSRAPPSLA